MGNSTGIEWTDATWNPIRGCSRVSEGCRNCYAERQAHRFSGAGQPYEGLTQLVNGHPAWTGKVSLVEKHLLDPLKWKGVFKDCEMCGGATVRNTCMHGSGLTPERWRSRRIFVNSMSDLFHENVPDEWIAKIVAVMIYAHQHIYQVLTKRPERMQPLLSSEYFWKLVDKELQVLDGAGCEGEFLYDPPCRHIHWGVSVEDQKAADKRIPLLLETPAAMRFISAEPLLGGIDAYQYLGGERNPIGPAYGGKGLDWVIVGGESGPGARPMHPDWARSLRDQCVAAGVPFFFKQWGEWGPVQWCDQRGKPWLKVSVPQLKDAKPNTREIVWDGVNMERVGKKVAGSLLNGREWKEFPR